jgi:hypothetical protein
VRTRFSVLVRKWVLPIHDLKIPKGCSTVCRRMPMASGIRSSLAFIALGVGSRPHMIFDIGHRVPAQQIIADERAAGNAPPQVKSTK